MRQQHTSVEAIFAQWLPWCLLRVLLRLNDTIANGNTIDIQDVRQQEERALQGRLTDCDRDDVYAQYHHHQSDYFVPIGIAAF